ncbi:hypothetical protein S40285_10496 [Stachybotrys chlorohalonatus IBT 40285]|uniref:Uncharacterized protein n=1 Tax=Stachybotrys chlorohalonatus (strain IBT 40285) TaxID=1283841 RepID=A0A084Q9M4_STAC4|nr:hypothetical protein S40285_10496 [Stachybotrys chlorohalonata IBT 40285]
MPSKKQQQTATYHDTDVSPIMLAPYRWTAADEKFATLFAAWPLPCTYSWEVLENLRALDSIIAPFEEHINHSAKGFYIWRQRHKMAMEEGLAAIPTYPPLSKPNKDYEMRTWDDDAWVKRYSYLVYLRESFTGKRLDELRLGRSRNAPALFAAGTRATGSKDTFAHHTPARHRKALLNRWCDPLDLLLERVAPVWGFDPSDLKALFWRIEPCQATPLQMEFASAQDWTCYRNAAPKLEETMVFKKEEDMIKKEED